MHAASLYPKGFANYLSPRSLLPIGFPMNQMILLSCQRSGKTYTYIDVTDKMIYQESKCHESHWNDLTKEPTVWAIIIMCLLSHELPSINKHIRE